MEFAQEWNKIFQKYLVQNLWSLGVSRQRECQKSNCIIYRCIHLLNTCEYCDNSCKYCGNTHEYWANTWKMFSPASAIFASIVTILVIFEAMLWKFSVRINFKSQFQSNDPVQALKYIKIASKLTSIVTILVNIALAGEHIFQVLGQY